MLGELAIAASHIPRRPRFNRIAWFLLSLLCITGIGTLHTYVASSDVLILVRLGSDMQAARSVNAIVTCPRSGSGRPTTVSIAVPDEYSYYGPPPDACDKANSDRSNLLMLLGVFFAAELVAAAALMLAQETRSTKLT